MKRTIVLAIFIASVPIVAFAQETGDWFGVIARPQRTQEEISIHIQKAQSDYKVSVDFPSANKKDVKPSYAVVDQEAIFLILGEQQIAIEGKIDHAAQKITGDIIYNGKRYPLILTHAQVKAVSNVTATTPAVRSVFNDGLSVDIESARTIEQGHSLFIEELTWLDVRDAKKQGKTTVIIATGGVEQSGPYIVMGKHNYVLCLAAESIAEKLGNALIAPIVPFVPEGSLSPPSGHVKYPGTISLREETYESLLDDIASSYLAEEFTNIVFIGDSGGNQWGMYVEAEKLSRMWAKEGRRVIYIPEYYDNDRLAAWLKERGIEEVSEGIHDNFKVTAQIAAVNPEFVRAPERIKAGKFSINGVPLAPLEKTIEYGKKIAEYQADVTVEAIRKRLEKQ